MRKRILIELYSDMSSNNYSDCRFAGDCFCVDVIDGIKLIDILIENHVEFTIYEVGNCVLDKSYEYWEDLSGYIFPEKRENIES